ncbi:MAG: sialate O-acetylesterase [Planctomycetes bacterium]|nr:sialate O-acetylesterase [Planctomycetota bacterium]
MIHKSNVVVISILLTLTLCLGQATAGTLKLHGIFSDHMVIQRDKPIKIWGWAESGQGVSVRFGPAKAEATADTATGRWQVTFPAQPADAVGRRLIVTSGGDSIELDDILMGDVWVMNGQSNMAFGLGKTYGADMEAATAHLPLLRRVGISANEAYRLQTDLPEDRVTGWTVCTPDSAPAFSSIGYSFGARVQRALQIPIGIVDNARGGASIESLVPRHKFDDDPLATRYLASVEKRRAEFDWDAAVQKLVDKWEKTVASQRDRGVAEDKLPPKPTRASLRSWNVPGWSPSDAASCYNGMFGAFKGLNIKGVLFHQGYNNAMGTSCWPKRYRVLMKLMIQGWREDFKDPTLPVGVIGFCAGSISQTKDNFETWSVSPGAFIRESQRLGLADVKDPANTAFLPAYDIQIPGLHPHKKQAHAVRAVRWALNRVYGMKIDWDTASLVSVERDGDCMVLTLDKKVMPDDMSVSPEGFSIADASGKFYLAHAAYPLTKDVGIWNVANKNFDATKIVVWSPLVKVPVAVRYAWGTSPMGNLKVNGKPWLPLHSFRTDRWDWPEHEDPLEHAVTRAQNKAMAREAAERLEFRRMEEARRAVEMLEQHDELTKKVLKAGQ